MPPVLVRYYSSSPFWAPVVEDLIEAQVYLCTCSTYFIVKLVKYAVNGEQSVMPRTEYSMNMDFGGQKL